MSDNGALTRKDLARMIDCHPETVRKNETRWGMFRFRLRGWTRPVRYRHAVVERLERQGVL